jgi:hypothetical protein
MKAFAGAAVLVAVLGAAAYWFFFRPVVWTAPEGYEVSLPHEWKVQPVEGGMSASGPVEGGLGSAAASFRPFSGRGRPDWPDAALAHCGARPEEYKTHDLAGRPAVSLIFQDGGRKYAALVVDRGDGMISFRIGCPPGIFDRNRPLFDRMVRRFTCGKR